MPPEDAELDAPSLTNDKRLALKITMFNSQNENFGKHNLLKLTITIQRANTHSAIREKKGTEHGKFGKPSSMGRQSGRSPDSLQGAIGFEMLFLAEACD